MPTDVILGDNEVIIDAVSLNARCAALRVIRPTAIKIGGGDPGGRALVHGIDGSLIINEEGLYNGVKVEGKHLAVPQLRVVNPNAKNDDGAPGGRALVHGDDNSLVVNEGAFYSGVKVEGKHLAVTQLRVVNPNAKNDGGEPGGRALTQSETNALVINEGKFYTGGTKIEGTVDVDHIRVHGAHSLIVLLPGRPPTFAPIPFDVVQEIFDLREQMTTLQKQLAALQKS